MAFMFSLFLPCRACPAHWLQEDPLTIITGLTLRELKDLTQEIASFQVGLGIVFHLLASANRHCVAAVRLLSVGLKRLV